MMSLRNEEFVRRFAQHILPRRFVRIRHYGILSSNWKRCKLQSLQQKLGVQRPEEKSKTSHRICPCCKIGFFLTIEVFEKRGPPKVDLLVTRTIPVI